MTSLFVRSLMTFIELLDKTPETTTHSDHRAEKYPTFRRLELLEISPQPPPPGLSRYSHYSKSGKLEL